MVHTKENRIVNVWGDPDSPVNKGHLCVKGRYQTWAEPRERITTPLIKGKPATWDEALAAVKKGAKVKKAEKALLLAPRVTNETAAVAAKLGQVAMYVGTNEAALCVEPKFSEDALRKLQDADAIIVIGAQPSRDNGVVAARIRIAVRKTGAKLLIFHARKSDLDQYADVAANVVSLESKLWDKVKATLASAQRPAIVYGPNAMTPIGITVMERLIGILENNAGSGEPLLLGLPRSRIVTGIPAVEDVGPWLDAKPLKFLHIVASDAPDGGASLLEEKHVPTLLEQIECVVVQASYRSALTEKASVVLPATIWCEKSGTVTNLEGRQLPLRPVLPAAGEARDDKAILENVYA
jgi:predicted molibdopterin-dependent oxidoreductase YjgC